MSADSFALLDQATGATLMGVGALTKGQKQVAANILGFIDRLATHEKQIRERDILQQSRLQSLGAMAPELEADRRARPGRRPHRTIVVAGGRGTGKTTLLLTLSHLIDTLSRWGVSKRPDLVADLPIAPSPGGWLTDGWGHALVLPTMFPALREAEGGLMEEIFGVIHHRLNESKCGSTAHPGADTLLGKLHKVWSGWVFGQHEGSEVLGRDSADFQDYVSQRAKAASEACLRQQSWADFVDDYLNSERRELLVICLDDSDLKPRTAIEVADTIHQYLAHPRIVTILASDLDDFRRHILGNELAQQRRLFETLGRDIGPYLLDYTREPETSGEKRSKHAAQIRKLIEDGIDSATSQCTEFLRKIMPPPQRHRLPGTVDNKNIVKILSATPLGGGDESETDYKTDEGNLGLWLLRYRYLSLLRNMTLRQLNQLRLWLDLRDDDLGAGRWSPKETMMCFVDDEADRKRLQDYFAAVEGRTADPASFDSNCVWQYGDAPPLAKEWQHAIVGAMADLRALQAKCSLRRTVQVLIKEEPGSLMLAQALTARESPLATTLPANAWYAADLTAITGRALSPTGKLEIYIPGLPPASPRRKKGFGPLLGKSGVSRSELADATFNAWLYWRKFPDSGQKSATFSIKQVEFTKFVQDLLPSRGGAMPPISQAFLDYLNEAMSYGSAIREQEEMANSLLRQALQVALVPPAGEDKREVQALVDNDIPEVRFSRLARVVRDGEADGNRATWRDRFMLAIAAIQPLADLSDITIGKERRQALGEAIDAIHMFLVGPHPVHPDSALDLVHVLGSWDAVEEQMADLVSEYAALSHAHTKDRNLTSNEATWLGVPPAGMRKLRDAHPYV